MTLAPTSESRPYLFALTSESAAALGSSEVELMRFPYRVGRESRGFESKEKKSFFADKRSPANPPNNDLYLEEDAEAMNVSREHFQIVREGANFALEDRGSSVGTIVEGQRLGGDKKGGRVALRDSDIIIVGSSASRHIFKFRLR